MSKIVFFIGFVCVLELVSCRVVREAPADTTLTLKDLQNKAETAFETLHADVLKFANVSSDSELTTLVKNQTETYAEQLKNLATQFTEEFKGNSDKISGFFKTIADSFTETANDLKAQNPALATAQDTFEKGLKSVLDETEKLRIKIKEDGAGISDNAEKILKSFYEETVETAKTVSQKLADATKKD